MANYIWKSTSVLYLTVAPSFWKWESKAYIRDRLELEKFCPLPWLKFIAVAPLSLWTPSPLWAPLTPWGPFASVWPFKPCSERPTQLNSTQPVLKMFRTQQTERFQLFWVVRVFRAPDALWTLLQLNSTQLNLTQMPVELSWVELSRVGLSEQGFTGSPVGGGEVQGALRRLWLCVYKRSRHCFLSAVSELMCVTSWLRNQWNFAFAIYSTAQQVRNRSIEYPKNRLSYKKIPSLTYVLALLRQILQQNCTVYI